MLIFWRGIFFFSLPHLAMRKRWSCGCDCWVWWQPCRLELRWPWLQCEFGGCFLNLGPGNGPAVRNICTGREQRGWDQLLPVCSSLPLRQKEFCFWSALTHFCLIPLFAYFFPSSHGYLSTGTENFTSWSPGMLLGKIIKKQNKISGC